jgi:hypothetical protein
MEFYSISIKKLDKLNLKKLLVYNLKQNVVSEYHFPMYDDLFCDLCFFYNPEVHKNFAIGLLEKNTLELLKNKIKKNEFFILEGDLEDLLKKSLAKYTMFKLLEEL